MSSTGMLAILLLAIVPSVASFDCYDTVCIGTDADKTKIPCPQKDHICSLADDGTPKCDPNPDGGKGVDCLSSNFYCTANETGSAMCLYSKSSCYNNMCQGTGDQSTTYIECDQSNSTCGVDDKGAPTCTAGNPGVGVNCTVDATHDEFYCQNNLTTGAALCVYPPKHDCYDTTCTGKEAFNTTVISCDQSVNRCGFNDTGAPLCINTTRGEGVDCSKDDQFYCSVDEKGAGLCVVPPKHTCYDTKCVGKTATIDCDQKDHRCVLDKDGEATCVDTTRGGGVDCTKDETHDEFYCQNNATSGAAVCVYPPKHDCYDTKCTGKDAFNTTVIPCDQSANRCGFNETGAPLCINTTRGSGSDCPGVMHLDFYCGVSADTGAAICEITPPSSCYNLKCVGTGDKNTTYIDCDQSKNLCQVNETTGDPLCVPLSRGSGVNCTKDETHDEFYCQNNATTGGALCVYPPKHDCYDTTCTGKDAFNTTVIPCDQTSNRCGFNDTGAPLCINTTRGEGVDCSKDDQFYCSVDEKGAGLCVVPPKHNCYDTKCVGKTATIDCDQRDHRCVLDKDGEATCVNTTRGGGVDCTKDETHDQFYCQNNATSGAALCVYPPKHTCYDTKCVGKTATIDCDQKVNRCVLDKDGEATCVNTTRGGGVDCTKDETHDEFYCQNNATTGGALCVYPPKHDCYDTTCTGIDSFNTTVIPCDQSANRCGLNETGAPICINTTRGAGVDCEHESPLDFYCAKTVGAAQCVFTPVKSCYTQFCQGSGSKNISWVSCDGAANRCDVADDGSPVCVPGSRGSGVNCNGTTSFFCSHAADSPFEAACHYSQNFSCYNSKCGGVFNYSDTYIGCSQDKSYCGVNNEGFPLCLNDTANTGDGIACTGHFSCTADKTSGVAACQKKSGLLPLWIVLGVVLAIVIVVIIIWVIKKRSSRADDRDSLITAAY